MTDDQAIRLECLQLAQNPNLVAREVMQVAEQYRRFLMGEWPSCKCGECRKWEHD